MAEKLRGEVTFVGVNALETGDPMLMPERHGIAWWPLPRDISGQQGNGLHRALGRRGIPITAFYDASGTLLDVTGGALDDDGLRQRITVLYGLEVGR